MEGLKEKNGMIHGRFQPFTIGHMEHLKKAINQIEKGNTIFVGITKPFITDNGKSKGDDHRDNKVSNPYTFEERKEMVLRSVEKDPEIQDRIDDICVIPWSMNNEEERNAIIEEYMPKKDVIQFMNIIPNDGWEYEKKQILEDLGFKTKNLVDPFRPRKTSATEVRTLRKNKDQNWTKKVPEGTKEVLEEINKGTLKLYSTNSVREYLELLIKTKEIANISLPRNSHEQEIVDKVKRKMGKEENTIER